MVTAARGQVNALTPFDSAVSGGSASFFGGEATFHGFRLTEWTTDPVRLTFTVQHPELPRLNLKTLTATINLVARRNYALRFAADSFWTASGAVRTLALQELFNPSAVLHVVDSTLAVDTAATGYVVRASAVNQDGTVLSLVGATQSTQNGVATFASLRTDGYVAGTTGVVFTFTLDQASVGSAPELSSSVTASGLNPVTAAAFGLRFASDMSGFTAEGQTARVKVGDSFGPVRVQLLDLAGNVDTTRSDVTVDALYNDSVVLQSRAVVDGVATFDLVFPQELSGTVVNMTFQARSSDPSAAIPPLVETTRTALRTGLIEVLSLAASIRFGSFQTGSAVTSEGQTLVVNQGDKIPDIIVELLSGDGTLDTTSVVDIVMSASNGTLQPDTAGGTSVRVVGGAARFADIRFADVPKNSILRFTVATVGVPVTSKFIETGVVTVRGRPHHIGRYLPYPTGAVLGVVTELKIAVYDENNEVVDDAAFTPPTISLSGAGVSPEQWTQTAMIHTTKFTLGSPLLTGSVARLTYTPVLSGVAFDPLELVVLLGVSAQDNSVVGASFIDPYTVPTVVKVGETQSIRVELQDSTASPAPDGDAAYVTVAEQGGLQGSLVMLHSTTPTVGGIQTIDFVFRGNAERNAVVLFSTNLPGKSIPDLQRQFKVLPGDPKAIQIKAIDNVVISSSVPTVAVGDVVAITFFLVDSEGNNVPQQGVSEKASGNDGFLGLTLTQVDTVPTSASGEGVVSVKYDGSLSAVPAENQKTLSLTTTTAGIEPLLQTFIVTAGRAHHIDVDIPATAISREVTLGRVVVRDRSNNAARDADATQIAMLSVSDRVGTYTVQRSNPSEFSVRFTPGDIPGATSMTFTPTLSGVVFDPTAVSRDVLVITPQYNLVFDSLNGAVREVGQTLSAALKERVPEIYLLVRDSNGGNEFRAGLAKGVKVRASILGATNPTGSTVPLLSGEVVTVVDGVARFTELTINRDPGQISPQFTFTAESDPNLGGSLQDAVVVGKQVQSGVVSLTINANSIVFAGSESFFTFEGQTANALQYFPFDPIRVHLVDSDGKIDDKTETTVATPPGLTVVATSSFDITNGKSFLSGATALVVNGVATFNRLAFNDIPPSAPTITFQIFGLPSDAKATLATLKTGAITSNKAPASIQIPFSITQPASFIPQGFLVHGVVNTVRVEVLDASNTTAVEVPASTALFTAVSGGAASMEVGAIALQGAFFSVPLKPNVSPINSNLISAETGELNNVSVAFTPALAFTAFNPVGIVKVFSLCAGQPRGVVFATNTPDTLFVGEVVMVTLHIVDEAEVKLSGSWSEGCRQARKTLGLAPPYAEDILSTISGSDVQLGANGATNSQANIAVPVVSTAVKQSILVTFNIQGGNDAMVKTVSRTFKSELPRPTRIFVTTQPQPITVLSGGVSDISMEVRTASNVVSVVNDVQISTESASTLTGGSIETQSISLGVILATIKMLGPPRQQTINFVPTRTATTFDPLTYPTAFSVLFANHSTGLYTSQYYQFFPNTQYSLDTNFIDALLSYALVYAASAPHCPNTEVCRELRSTNVQLVAPGLWPVPPVGNATPSDSLPSRSGYVFRFVTSEESNIKRLETFFRSAHSDAALFTTLAHSTTQPVKFLGFLDLVVPGPAVVCSAYPTEAVCTDNGCKWSSAEGRCIDPCRTIATKALCRSTDGCVWDWRIETAPVCIIDVDADGPFERDPLGSDWWMLLLLGLALLWICLCIACCLRMCCCKEKQKVDDNESDPPQTHNWDEYPQPSYNHPESYPNTHPAQHPPGSPLRRRAVVNESYAAQPTLQPTRPMTEQERILQALGEVDDMMLQLDSNGAGRSPAESPGRDASPSYDVSVREVETDTQPHPHLQEKHLQRQEEHYLEQDQHYQYPRVGHRASPQSVRPQTVRDLTHDGSSPYSPLERSDSDLTVDEYGNVLVRSTVGR